MRYRHGAFSAQKKMALAFSFGFFQKRGLKWEGLLAGVHGVKRSGTPISSAT